MSYSRAEPESPRGRSAAGTSTARPGSGARRMSRSSWTATDAGRRRAACRGSRDIAAASRLCAARSARRSSTASAISRSTAFSSENWRRPPDEVGDADGPAEALHSQRPRGTQPERRAGPHHRRARQSLARHRALLVEAESLTEHNRGLTLTVAFNYGGRQEIVEAARRIAIEVRDGRSTRTRSTWTNSRRVSTRPACPIPISSSARPARCACRISCCGSAPTPNLSSCRSCGRISTMPPSSRRSSNMRRASGGSAPCRNLHGAHRLMTLSAAIGADLGPRVLAAVVMGLAALAAAWVGGFVFVAFWWAASSIVFWEWQRLIRADDLIERISDRRRRARVARRSSPCTGQLPAALPFLSSARGSSAGSPGRARRAGRPADVIYAGALVVSLALLRGQPVNYGFPRSCGCSRSSGASISRPISPGG